MVQRNIILRPILKFLCLFNNPMKKVLLNCCKGPRSGAGLLMWKPCILSFLNLSTIVKVAAMMKIMSRINDHNIENGESHKDDADANDCNLQPV